MTGLKTKYNVYVKHQEEKNMKLNYRLLTVLLFALAVSICAGSFFEVFMTGEGKQQIENILGSLLNAESDDVMGLSSFGSCFLRIFVKNALMLLLAYLSPALLITMPILPSFMLLRGLSLGFSAAMTLEVAGVKGILYIVTILLPQNLIQLPVYCILSVLSIQACVTRIRQISEKKRSTRHTDARRYSFIFLAGFVLITLSCLLEALLVTSI